MSLISVILLTSSALAEPKIDTSFRLNIRPTVLSNPDYNSDTKDSLWFVHQGVRANFKGTWKGLIIKAALQDARVWGTEAKISVSSDPSAGLHEGYFQFGTADNKTLWARIGRQEYNLNQGRFFWKAGWPTAGRAFDAVRIHNEVGNLSGDLVGMVWKKADNYSSTTCIETGTELNECTQTKTESLQSAGDMVFVASAESKISAQFTAQPYLITLIDGPDSISEEVRQLYTPGVRFLGRINDSFSYDVEGVYQLGKDDADTAHSAWMAGARIDYKNGPLATHVLYEEHSGDGDATDDVNNNFESFLGARHRYRGFADQVGGMNVRDISTGAGYQVNEFVALTAAYHFFQMSNPEGSWINAGGQIIGTAAAGNEDANLGHELDIVATWKPVKGVKLRLSNAVFIPIGAGTELAGNDPYNTTYLWMTAVR